MKSITWNILKIGVTLAIIVFLFSRVDLALMVQHLARANPWLLLIALLLYFLAIAIGAFKWQVLVNAQNLTGSFSELLTYSFVGLFFGNLLPTNVGGDVVRAYGLVRASGRAEAAAISVLVDRLMGLVAFLGAAVVMASLATATLTRGNELEQIEIATVVAATLLILGAALMFSRRVGQRIKSIFDLAPLRRLQPMAQRVYHALQVYRHSYRALALNLMLSASIVIVTTFVWYAVALALDVNISIFYFFLFNPLIAFVLLIPISFNGLGAKEATAFFFFGLVGVPGELAISMSLIFHLIVVLTSLPGGALWWRERSLAPAKTVAESPLQIEN
ncbi:MAG: flippase-like domain-containing protein [Chloroflexi bacterium]|nr:flippase-like domain-containing protein [Chloroflexota bacterium]